RYAGDFATLHRHREMYPREELRGARSHIWVAVEPIWTRFTRLSHQPEASHPGMADSGSLQTQENVTSGVVRLWNFRSCGSLKPPRIHFGTHRGDGRAA